MEKLTKTNSGLLNKLRKAVKLTALALLVQATANAQSACDGTLGYDKMISSFHSTIVLGADGNYRVWGEDAASDGDNNLLSPTIINKSNFPALLGTPVKATLGSNYTYSAQFFVLTENGNDDKLFVWGE